jgi:uncharacterized protein (TIGR02266 family)
VRGPPALGLNLLSVDYIDRFQTAVKRSVIGFALGTDLAIMVTAVSRLPTTKTVLVAHRTSAVRDRFAVALADARHEAVAADSEVAALGIVEHALTPFSLALVDLGLSSDPVAFVRALRERAAQPLPVMIFSGSLRSAADVPPLAGMNVGFINEFAGTPQILPALAPHLYPDNFNRRTGARLSVGVPVTYRTPETLAGAVTLDVGKGGVAIRTMTPLAKGVSVQLKFRLPNTPGDVETRGHVVWSDRNVGMGVQFDEVSSVHGRTLDAFLEAGGDAVRSEIAELNSSREQT